MSNEYCCQIFSTSGRILETFHEDYLEAVRKCTMAPSAIAAFVFRYPDMENPICVARTLK